MASHGKKYKKKIMKNKNEKDNDIKQLRKTYREREKKKELLQEKMDVDKKRKQ